MRVWPVIYRLLGGRGPQDPEKPLPRPIGYRIITTPEGRTMRAAIYPGCPFASRCAAWLVEHGFLSRDPTLRANHEAAYYINYRWQWRFWRGPYKDCLEAEERKRQQILQEEL